MAFEGLLVGNRPISITSSPVRKEDGDRIRVTLFLLRQRFERSRFLESRFVLKRLIPRQGTTAGFPAVLFCREILSLSDT